MKNLFASALTLCFAALTISACGVRAQEIQTYRVGAFDNYPVIYRDNGGFRGFYVDLLNEIGKREHIRFEYVYGTWSDGLERIKTGDVDLLTSVAKTPERTTFMDYPQTPILTVWGDLYVPRSSTLDSVLEISNKKIGVMKDDVNYANFKDLLTKFNMKVLFVEYSSYEDVFQAVKDKKVDAGVAGITYGQVNADSFGLKSSGIVYNPINLYFATAKGKNAKLLTLLDTYLRQWKEKDDSYFKQAERKWLHGPIDTVNVVPSWIVPSFMVFSAMLLVAAAFIVLLRFRVRKATDQLKGEMENQRKNEKIWKLMFEKSNDALVTVEPPDWRFTSGNQAALKLFGVESLDEFSKMAPGALSPEKQPDGTSSVEKANALCEKALSEGSVSFEWTHKRKNGEEFIALILLTSMEFLGKKFIQGTIRDITDRKLMEKELLRSKVVLQAKVDELEKFNAMTVDRELKMIELKKELDKLKNEKKAEGKP